MSSSTSEAGNEWAPSCRSWQPHSATNTPFSSSGATECGTSNTATRSYVIGTDVFAQADSAAAIKRFLYDAHGSTRSPAVTRCLPVNRRGSGWLPSRLLRSLEGPEAETAPQGSITFHTIRDYVRGDDLRHVHWRTTARTGTLMVRQLVDTSFPDVTVVLDDRPGPYPGDAFEPAVEIVASIVVACTRERFPVHLRTPGGVALDSAGDPRAEVRALDVLTQLTPAPGPSLVAVLDRLGRDGQGSAAVLVTGSVDADQLAPLALLRRRFPVVVAVLVRPDAEGDAVPSVPGVTVLSVADSTAFAARWRTKAAR